MDNALDILICWQVLAVAIPVSIILLTLNKFSSKLENNFMKSKWAQKLQPLIPFPLAAIFSLAISPDVLTTIPQYLIWSLIPGLVSNVGYKIIKTAIFDKFGADLLNDEEEKNDDKK